MLTGLDLWGVTQCCLGDLSTPSLLFTLKPEAGETFSVLFGNIFSPSCLPSETKMGKVSLKMGTVSAHSG